MKRFVIVAAMALLVGILTGCEDPPPPNCGPLTMQEFCDSNP